tara:strand:+ start:547 stop:702 length:156 start_codon:yes stop_codon:yes gene_type:complete
MFCLLMADLKNTLKSDEQRNWMMFSARVKAFRFAQLEWLAKNWADTSCYKI